MRASHRDSEGRLCDCEFLTGDAYPGRMTAIEMDTMNIDNDTRSRRDEWIDDILVGRVDRIAAAFEPEAVPPPTLLWAPQPGDARTKAIAFLIRHFTRTDIENHVDPIALRPALGYINLLEPVAGGADFRYRIFGTHVAEASDLELTGRYITDMPASEHVIDFAIASYRAVMLRRAPLLSVRYPARARLVGFWERLVVPYRCVRSGAERLLVGLVPVEADGSGASSRLTI